MQTGDLRWFNGVLQVFAPTSPEAIVYEWRDVPSVSTYGQTIVTQQNGWVETTMPTGEVLHALPMATAEDVARAHSLGYEGDVWLMTKDHDRFHAMLATFFDLPESPALRHAVLGHDSELAGAEESLVLAFQRYANLCRKAGIVK